MKYLLAAEVDQIQDLLFRSSRLREVVGGSQLLTRFCEDIPSLLDVPKEDIITSGGGSFYVEFESEDAACRFGAALAQVYNRATGGTLSVADPVKIVNGYGLASQEAGERLRQAKRRGSPVATPHIPYIAFCESCGIGLAIAHERRIEGEGEKHYICPSCRAKADEQADESVDRFLKPFYQEVEPDAQALSEMDWPHDADAVGRYDARGYVGYIVADGDGLGRIFSECNKEQAAALSKEMDRVLRYALAEPIRQFMRNPAAEIVRRFLPVLPLIMGGDDLFALVPAPWALDIARRLCEAFQREMTAFAQKQGLELDITMTAAVVICKANYPYYLAHQIGERRLADAKRMVKALVAQTGTHLSAVDFEVVLGSQIEPKELAGERRPTMRPYWVKGGDGVKIPPGWGLSVDELLDWRYRLVYAASRRRSQLRGLFDRVPALPNDADALRQWDDELERLLKRIERDLERGATHPVRAALETLGGTRLEEWYHVERESDQDSWRGHSLPDLLRGWDWMFNLDLAPVKYEGGER